MADIWKTDDYLGPVLLLAAAILALATWRRERVPGGSAFWLLAGLGLLLLAIDERWGLHEKSAIRLAREGVGTPAGLNHLDDAILLSVAVAGLMLCLVFVNEIVRTRAFFVPFLAGLGATAAALAVDARAPLEGWAPKIEEVLELAGQTLFVVAFWRRYRLAGRVWNTGRVATRTTPMEAPATAD